MGRNELSERGGQERLLPNEALQSEGRGATWPVCRDQTRCARVRGLVEDASHGARDREHGAAAACASSGPTMWVVLVGGYLRRVREAEGVLPSVC